MQARVEKFMRLALELAAKARGETFPNPLVGAVIVKNGRLVGKGFHRKAGGAHAEILALQNAGVKARGAALFCTMEPCAHYGRTGPCVDEIKRAGIKEVYAGILDPNPLTNGKGVRFLRENGIRVQTGFLEAQIKRLNEPFIKVMTKGVPFVTIKIAESLDGKIATRTGESRWITNDRSRRYSHDMRRFFDGIMVGINTVLKDDPRLEPSKRFKAHRLTKIIVDSQMKMPLDAKLLKTGQPVVIAAVRKNKAKEETLIRKGARVLTNQSKKGRVDLGDLLRKLAALEIRNILVEGGSELIGSFLDERCADKALIFIAPKIIGGKDALSSVGGMGIASPGSAIRLENITYKKIDSDILLEGSLRYR
jgi:diaminohydroxyphosphoribosylaminopyrimidine deaminase/5-amino-6-(5-phosphoribosylamino)uracil reductase